MTQICRANLVFLLPMFLVQETENCITEPGGEASPARSLNPLTFYILLYYFFKKSNKTENIPLVERGTLIIYLR